MHLISIRFAMVSMLLWPLGLSCCAASDYFTLVPHGKHVAVGEVVTMIIKEGKPTYISGTGTLIAPNLVLTASHVVSGALAPQGIQFTITLPDGRSWTRPVLAYRTHPHYLDPARLTEDERKVVDYEMLAEDSADIAVLRLFENAPSQVKKFPELGKLPTEVGSTVEAVGFGQIEGKTNAASAKRSGQLQFCEKSKEKVAIFRTPPGKLQRTNHGDSGGPLLEIDGEDSRIVAITQGGRFYDKLHGLDPGSYGIYVSIEDNLAWIEGARKELDTLRLLETPYYYLTRNADRAPAQLALTRQQIAGLLSIETPDQQVMGKVITRGMNEPIPQEVLDGWVKKYKNLNPDQFFVHAMFSKKPTPPPTKLPTAPTSDAGAPKQNK